MTGPSALIDRLPRVVRATVYALLAALFFSGMAIFIRQASFELHPTVIVFFRNLLALAFMGPWLLSAGLGAMRTQRIGMFAFRSSLGLIGMTSGFWAVTLIPISQATALSFTSPIFATIGAALILGEVVRLRRWTAVILGFWGAMIVVVGDAGGIAGLGALELGVLLALLNAVIMAANKLVLKSLTRTESSEAIVTYMVLLLTPLSLVPAIFFWTWPSPMGFFWLCCLAFAGTLGHLCITRAFQAAEVTVVLPFDFARLPISAGLAFLIFAEVPTVWTILGGLVIFAATFYIARREAQLARLDKTTAPDVSPDGPTPPPPDTTGGSRPAVQLADQPTFDRSIRFHFRKRAAGGYDLERAAGDLTLAPPCHGTGPMAGMTGCWLQLETADGVPLYRHICPGLLAPLYRSDETEEPLHADPDVFDINAPLMPGAEFVAVYAPPPEDGGRPLVGRPAEPIARAAIPELAEPPAPAPAVSLPSDICGDGKGQVLSVAQVWHSGREENVHNFIILAEGFDENEQDTFTDLAMQALDFLLARPPYVSSHGARSLNVFLVRVTSNSDDVLDGKGYFSARPNPNATQSTSAVWDQACVSKVCDALFSKNGKRFWSWAGLIVNEERRALGTARGGQFVATTAKGFQGRFQHEYGHTAFHLSDEYGGYKGAYAGGGMAVLNVTSRTDRADLRWKDSIDPDTPIPTLGDPTNCDAKDSRSNPVADGTVGLYAGGMGYSCGLYHPVYDCVMNHQDRVDGIFCDVCMGWAERRVLQTFALTAPSPGQLFYTPISGAWTHLEIANAGDEFGTLLNYGDHDQVIAQLNAGGDLSAVEVAFAEESETVDLTNAEVLTAYFDAAAQTGLWYLHIPGEAISYYVHAYRVPRQSRLTLGSVDLAALPKLPRIDCVRIGLEAAVFDADADLLMGRIGANGLLKGDLVIQKADGLDGHVRDVSAVADLPTVHAVITADDKVKIGAYQLIAKDWAPAGFVTMPSVPDRQYYFVEAAMAGTEVHVLATADEGLYHGAFDTRSGAWSLGATPTPFQDKLPYPCDLAATDEELFAIYQLGFDVYMMRFDLRTKQWSQPERMNAAIGKKDADRVNAIAVGALNGELHLVMLIDGGAVTAVFDIARNVWTRQLTDVVALDGLKHDVGSLAMHPMKNGLYLALSRA